MNPKENRFKRQMRSLVTSPLIFLVALYILLEEFLETVVKPMIEHISNWKMLQSLEGFLRKRNPYMLFVIYSVKFVLFSSIKLLSLYWISQGRVYGAPMLVTGELCGAAFTVWYAKVALPALLTLRWFAAGYEKVVAIKNWLVSKLRQMRTYQYAQEILHWVRQKISGLKQFALHLSKREGKSCYTIRAIYRFLSRKR